MPPEGGGGGVDVGLNPQPVYTAGKSVADLKGDASAASTKFTSALTDGSGAVHHAKLAAALSEYHQTWSGPAQRLPGDVEAAGNGIANTGVEGQRSDDQSAADQSPFLLPPTNDGGPLLSKPITVN